MMVRFETFLVVSTRMNSCVDTFNADQREFRKEIGSFSSQNIVHSVLAVVKRYEMPFKIVQTKLSRLNWSLTSCHIKRLANTLNSVTRVSHCGQVGN